MELRKLIAFGKGSLIISLPKSWTQSHHLKKGSIVSVHPNDQGILISPKTEQKREKKEVRVVIDDKSKEEVETEITTAYVNSVDILELVGKDSLFLEEAKYFTQNLAGMEIFDQTSNKVIARFLIDMKEISLHSLIRRMDNIARSLISDNINSIGSKGDMSILKRDRDLNRLYFLLRRTTQVMMQNHTKPWHLRNILFIGTGIEQIGDNQKRIARGLAQLHISKKFALELKQTYQLINDSYLEVMNAYHKKDSSAALKVETTNKQRTDACDALLRKDFKREYKLLSKHSSNMSSYVHEHMIITEIVTNIKIMSSTIRRIAQTILDD